jgi:hypothetical protein
MTAPKFLSRREASEYVSTKYGFKCKPATLAKFAHFGDGPRYVVTGNCTQYAINDLDEWARSRTKPAATKGWIAKRAEEAEKAAAPRAA